MGASLVLAVSMPVPPQPVEKRREEAPAAAEPEASPPAAGPPAAEHGDSAPSPAAEGGSQKKAAVDEANALFASAAHRRQGSTSTEGGTPRPKATGSVWDADAASARESADGDDDVRAPLLPPPPAVTQLLRAPPQDDELDLALSLSHTGFAAPAESFGDSGADDDSDWAGMDFGRSVPRPVTIAPLQLDDSNGGVTAGDGGEGAEEPRTPSPSPRASPTTSGASPSAFTSASEEGGEDEDDLMAHALGRGVRVARPLSVAPDPNVGIEVKK